MSYSKMFKIIEDSEIGVVLNCFDAEISDQFDDFLIENLDQDVHFKFQDGCTQFLFGKAFSASDVLDLCYKFEKNATPNLILK